MKILRLVLLSCVWFTCASFVCAKTFDDVVPPSFGDVRLERVQGKTSGRATGRLLTYFTDGESSGEWGSVSTEHELANTYYYVARAACRMLGYTDAAKGEATAGNATTGAKRIWLYNVTCLENATNIFQCEYEVYNNESTRGPTDQFSHTDDYYVTCKDEQTKFWNGQVRLCKPDQVSGDYFNASNPIQQISYGIMQVHVLEDSVDAWRRISDDTKANSNTIINLETHEADTFCRQMGYSHAVLDSALHVSAVSDFTFTTCVKNSTKQWKASKIKCENNGALPCFTCCFKEAEACGHGECANSFDIVLRCMSDIFARGFPKTGNQSICEANSSKKDCGSKEAAGNKLTNRFIGVTVVGVIAIVIVLIEGFVIIALLRKSYGMKRNGYESLQEPSNPLSKPPSAVYNINGTNSGTVTTKD